MNDGAGMCGGRLEALAWSEVGGRFTDPLRAKTTAVVVRNAVHRSWRLYVVKGRLVLVFSNKRMAMNESGPSSGKVSRPNRSRLEIDRTRERAT